MKTHKTAKGTELPILALRGKDYLEVKYRVVWFREDHPDWSIETELISLTDQSAYARATIRDQHGRIITTSHKYEDVKGFPDFMEKAETGAIGRALALIGYGTQFCADELSEGERIVDSPTEVGPKPQAKLAAVPSPEPQSNADDPGEHMITFGKYKNRRIKNIDIFELDNYIKWLSNSAASGGNGHGVSVVTRRVIAAGEAFLKSREFNRDGGDLE